MEYLVVRDANGVLRPVAGEYQDGIFFPFHKVAPSVVTAHSVIPTEEGVQLPDFPCQHMVLRNPSKSDRVVLWSSAQTETFKFEIQPGFQETIPCSNTSNIWVFREEDLTGDGYVFGYWTLG